MPTRASLHVVAALVRAQLVDEGVRGLDVEQARLQRNQHLVGERITASSSLPCRPAGVSSTTWVVPLGGLDDVVAGEVPALDRRRRVGRSASQWRDDCWRSTSPSITAWPCARREAGDVGGQRALADPALGVGDDDHRHAASSSVVAGMLAAHVRHSGYVAAPRRTAGHRTNHRRHRAIRQRRTMPTSCCCSPTPSWSIRASTGACCKRRARRRARAPARAGSARPVRAVSRLPDRRRRRAGGAAQRRGWWSGCIRCTGTACRRCSSCGSTRCSPTAGPTGRAAPRCAGKDLWLVASTGGAEDSYRPDGYNRYFFDAFLPPYEQTARWPACASCRRWCCTARTG